MSVERRRVLYLSPIDDCEAALLAAVTASTKSVHLLCYALTDRALIDLLKAKHASGQVVGVVVDSTQAAGTTQAPLMQELADAGIEVTIARSPAGGIVHEKCILVDIEFGALSDQSFAIYGSYNFSGHTAEIQDNCLISDNDPAICAQFFQRYVNVRGFGKAHVRQLPASVSQTVSGPNPEGSS